MTHLDQMITDALAQSPDTVVYQLASEVVRLRAAIGDALRPLYEGGHIYAKPLEDAIRKPTETEWVPTPEEIQGASDMIACDLIKYGSAHVLERGGVVVPEMDAPTICGLIETYVDDPREIDGVSTAQAVMRWFRENSRAIPADRELGGGDRFDIGFVEACGLLAARPFDRPTLAAGLIREGGMVAALERTSSDGAGIEILREEMRSDLDALRAQPTTERGGDTDGCSICGKHMRLEEIEPNVTPATHIACWQRHRQPTQEPAT